MGSTRRTVEARTLIPYSLVLAKFLVLPVFEGDRGDEDDGAEDPDGEEGGDAGEGGDGDALQRRHVGHQLLAV